MFKVGDEVSVKGEITKVGESGVVVKAHYFGEAYFDRSNMDLIGKTYEQGLADAWELAKKLANLSSNAYVEIFGAKGLYSIVWVGGETEHCKKTELTKTGKHIDIESLLRQIGE